MPAELGALTVFDTCDSCTVCADTVTSYFQNCLVESLFKFTFLGQTHKAGLGWGVFLHVGLSSYEKCVTLFVLPRDSSTARDSQGG